MVHLVQINEEKTMDIEEYKDNFLKFACPFILVVTPIAMVLMYRAPNPPEDHVGPATYAIFTAIGIVAIWLSFQFCRDKMGWFGGKKDKE